MKKLKIPLLVICAVYTFVGSLALISALWYVNNFGDIGFSSIVFTLTTTKSNVETGIASSYLWKGLIPSIVLAVAVFSFLWCRPKTKITFKDLKKQKKRTLYPFSSGVASILSVIIILSMLISAAYLVSLPQYVMSFFDKTYIYEKEYADPSSIKIEFPEEKRNIIYIYLESMETTFLSQEQGGALEYNVIPELYDIAKENVNFSHNNDVGGWPVTTNATWTVAAIVSQTSGVPLSTPLEENLYGINNSFLPGITTMQDVLRENGYYQAVMFGSDANFGYRDKYYYQHGVDKIYDLFSARDDGIIPKDYQVWWGMEDLYLYQYAKKELVKIAAQDKPFMFTMLTADTHHVGGYKCSNCRSVYDEQYENVYSCASKQLAMFLEWLEKQPFYENTTIVICGDHASMDKAYFDRTIESSYNRHVYNCIINSAVSTDNTKDRVFTPFDMFPTTLAAAGCRIEGERLGLGTNMFSDVPTLSEKYSSEYVNEEIGKSSDFYLKRFCKSK